MILLLIMFKFLKCLEVSILPSLTTFQHETPFFFYHPHTVPSCFQTVLVPFNLSFFPHPRFPYFSFSFFSVSSTLPFVPAPSSSLFAVHISHLGNSLQASAWTSAVEIPSIPACMIFPRTVCITYSIRIVNSSVLANILVNLIKHNPPLGPLSRKPSPLCNFSWFPVT